MNLFLGVLSLLSCTAIGYFLSVKFTDRKNFYYDFVSFNEKLINEVSFGQRTVLSLINEENTKKRAFGIVLSDLIKGKKKVEIKFLSDDEISFLSDYAAGLGKSDRKTQITFLSGYQNTLSEKKKRAETELGKYKDLYVKIGFLLGLIIFIALI